VFTADLSCPRHHHLNLWLRRLQQMSLQLRAADPLSHDKRRVLAVHGWSLEPADLRDASIKTLLGVARTLVLNEQELYFLDSAANLHALVSPRNEAAALSLLLAACAGGPWSTRAQLVCLGRVATRQRYV
jgi:Rubisco LSMT substrate-binding